MNRIGTFFAVLTASLGVQASDLPLEARIESAMYGAHRPASDIARNRYRHPTARRGHSEELAAPFAR